MYEEYARIERVIEEGSEIDHTPLKVDSEPPIADLHSRLTEPATKMGYSWHKESLVPQNEWG